MNGQAVKLLCLFPADEDAIRQGYPDMGIQARLIAKPRAVDQFGIKSPAPEHPPGGQSPLKAHRAPGNSVRDGLHTPANFVDAMIRGFRRIGRCPLRPEFDDVSKGQKGNGGSRDRQGRCRLGEEQLAISFDPTGKVAGAKRGFGA